VVAIRARCQFKMSAFHHIIFLCFRNYWESVVEIWLRGRFFSLCQFSFCFSDFQLQHVSRLMHDLWLLGIEEATAWVCCCNLLQEAASISVRRVLCYSFAVLTTVYLYGKHMELGCRKCAICNSCSFCTWHCPYSCHSSYLTWAKVWMSLPQSCMCCLLL
jgi:hypothetical protein